MPFLHFDTDNSDLNIGLWRVEETEMFFLTRLKLFEHEWQKLSTISHPQKRLEWLSSRLCLKEILKISNQDQVQSLNKPTGKPYLSSESHAISYSHSQKYAAAIASQKGEVGIDIEYFQRKRNPRTRFLFMNEAELALYEANSVQALFLTIWSSKETLYKVFSQKGVSFKDDISLHFSSPQLAKRGVIPATISRDGVTHSYQVHYALFQDFVLTYALEGPSKKNEPRLEKNMAFPLV